MAYKVYFNPARIALNIELKNHPRLLTLLEQYKRDEETFPEMFS